MIFATVTDIYQWQYVFPNLLALELYKRDYEYHIFSNCAVTCNRLKVKVKQQKFKYGNVQIHKIPGFYEFLKIKPLIPNHDWITPATMDRFVITYESDLEKYTYIDIDTLIVSDDVFELQDIETSDKGIAGVPSETKLIEHTVSFSNSEFLLDLVENDTNTFNAGICVFENSKLRNNNLKDYVVEIYERGNNNYYINDELILNLYDPNFYYLDEKFNSKVYLMEAQNYTPADISILHFSGKGFKPWANEHISKHSLIRKYYGLWNYYYYSLF